MDIICDTLECDWIEMEGCGWSGERKRWWEGPRASAVRIPTGTIRGCAKLESFPPKNIAGTNPEIVLAPREEEGTTLATTSNDTLCRALPYSCCTGQYTACSFVIVRIGIDKGVAAVARV